MSASRQTATSTPRPRRCRTPKRYRYDFDMAEIVELWRRGSVVASWLLDLTARRPARRSRTFLLLRARLGFGRGALDAAGRDRRGGTGARARRGAVRPVLVARRGGFRRPRALRHAARVRRPCREGRSGAVTVAPLRRARALRGQWRPRAQNDLSRAPRAGRRGRLPGMVVGVAKSDWSLDDLRDRVRDAVVRDGRAEDAALAQLLDRLRWVAGDYSDRDTFRRLRDALGPARHPLHYLAIPPSLFPVVVSGLVGAGCATGARVVVEKPFGRDLDLGARRSIRPFTRVFDEDGDLSHRPLSRQGGGAEPPLLPLRQRLPRADLEPHLRRSRPDHHGRGVRRRRARPVLRRGRRDPRRGAEPPPAGGRDPRDGAARRRRRPPICATRR